jgi:phosphoribosyl-AMP cyclohydrolase
MVFCWDLPQHLERKTEKMNKDKESVVELMVAVYESVNTKMALMSGMSEEEIEQKTLEANPAMTYYMSEIYNKLDENDIIRYE